MRAGGGSEPGRTRGPKTIGRALENPANGFTAVRLVLALAVVISHGFSLGTGRQADEPLVGLTGYTLGEHAVNGFFAISGFLVTMSFVRRGAWDYALSRALRIGPGFVAAAVVVTFGLGTALTRLDARAYLSDPGTWRYVTGLLTTFKTNAMLPGVFADNAIHIPIGTIWSLKYEVICYACVFVIGLLGLLRDRRAVTAATVILFVGLFVFEVIRPDHLRNQETAPRLLFLFGLGATLYLWRDRIRLRAWPIGALALAAILAHGTPAYRGLVFAAEGYGVLWLALSPALARPSLDPRQDLSYGTYLYGWPVHQALIQLFPAVSAFVLLAPALLVTLLVAAASWFAVERPCLALKTRTLGRRTLRTIEPAAP